MRLLWYYAYKFSYVWSLTVLIATMVVSIILLVHHGEDVLRGLFYFGGLVIIWVIVGALLARLDAFLYRRVHHSDGRSRDWIDRLNKTSGLR